MKEELIEYIYDEFVEEEGIKIGDESPLISSGIIDSFSIVSLKTWLEKKEGITIPDTDGTVENFETVNKIIDLVGKCKQA